MIRAGRFYLVAFLISVLSLESYFLQRSGFWYCIPLADAPLAPGADHDPGISKSGQAGRKYSDSLFALADLCGISESGCLVFKLKRKTHTERCAFISSYIKYRKVPARFFCKTKKSRTR